MTPEAQRIAIAELCGWVDVHLCSGVPCGVSPPKPKSEHLDTPTPWPVPRYHTDLNAMRDAEIAIGLHDRTDHALRVRWVNVLREIVSRRMPRNSTGAPLTTDADLLHASAAERAEALLVTLKMWKPEAL